MNGAANIPGGFIGWANSTLKLFKDERLIFFAFLLLLFPIFVLSFFAALVWLDPLPDDDSRLYIWVFLACLVLITVVFFLGLRFIREIWMHELQRAIDKLRWAVEGASKRIHECQLNARWIWGDMASKGRRKIAVQEADITNYRHCAMCIDNKLGRVEADLDAHST